MTPILGDAVIYPSDIPFQYNGREGSNFIQVAPVNTGDLSHHMYCTHKWDADAEYLGSVKMVLSSHVVSINIVDQASIRKAHEELMTQVKTGAIHIGNKYKIQ